MSITVTCDACSHTLKVKDELAGKRGKCPKCQATIVIPALSAVTGTTTTRVIPPKPALPPSDTKPTNTTPVHAAPQSRPPLSAAEIRSQVLDAFPTSLERPKTPLGFKLRVLVTAGVVLLFPLLYALLVLGLWGGAIWYLLSMGSLQTAAPGFGGMLIYYGPVALGIGLGLLLLKPLIAPRPAIGRPKPLSRDKAPLLFELQDKIAAALGASAPGKMAADCSLGVEEWGGGLELGLPRVVALRVDELAGMLAHHCAHRARGTGAGSAGFLRGMCGFFFRAVRGKDAWDEGVYRATTKRGSWLGKLLWPVRLAFGLVKVLLWPLNYLTHMLAGLVVQKTEYQADLDQCRLVGSARLISSLKGWYALDFAWQQVLADLSFQRGEQQLPDSLPRQLELNFADVPEDFREILAERVNEAETSDFANHPADKDRIAAAQEAALPGAYSCSLPASVLFADFDTLARDVTWEYYLVELGPPLERRFLRTVTPSK